MTSLRFLKALYSGSKPLLYLTPSSPSFPLSSPKQEPGLIEQIAELNFIAPKE
jgi:hypothetical protein